MAMVPCWLQDFCRRQFCMSDTHELLPIQVLKDMAQWALAWGPADTVLAAEALIRDPTANPQSPAEALAELVFKVLEVKEAVFAKTAMPRVEELTGAGAVFLPELLLRKACSGLQLPGLTRDRITEILQLGGVGDAPAVYNGAVGWHLPLSWWLAQHRRYLQRSPSLEQEGATL
jgi:hypothetical protein